MVITLVTHLMLVFTSMCYAIFVAGFCGTDDETGDVAMITVPTVRVVAGSSLNQLYCDDPDGSGVGWHG